MEDSLQRLVSSEKFKNICLVEALTKAKRELKKEKTEKETAENKYIETQERLKKVDLSIKQQRELHNQKKLQIQKEQQELKSKLEPNYNNQGKQRKTSPDNDLEQKLQRMVKVANNYKEQIEWLKNREEEIIKRMDLNEIDLVTERLKIFGFETDEKPAKQKVKKHPKVPKLDFEKIMKMREEDEEEYEEEEEEVEVEEDVKSSQKQFLHDGSALVSDDSFDRREELKYRKEQVIALLNKTYGDEDEQVMSYHKK